MNKRVLLLVGVAVAVLVVGLLAFPVKQRCGHPHYSCATAPDAQANVHYYYETKPLGVSLFETLTGADISFHYSSGTDSEKRGGLAPLP
jgi:hypothetical protein